jgi:hypothetical protein
MIHQPRATPWAMFGLGQALKGRNRSVPYVALVICNTVPVQQPSEFFLEAEMPMVFFLLADVGMQCRSDLASDHGLAVFGAEDDVNQNLGE